ncbi:General stress protein A, partial [Haemophilus influenzae]
IFSFGREITLSLFYI